MKKILITGVTGYIGGRLLEYLSCNNSYEICGTSRHIPPALQNKFPQTKFYNIDLLNLGDFSDEFCEQVDCIVHLAAANEIVSAKNPVRAAELNTLASIRLLETAKKCLVSRFIYLSTAHVYGTPLTGHLDESSHCAPTHPYAITHKAAEDFVLAAHKKQELEGVVLRLSNSFGAPLCSSVNRWSLLLNEMSRNIIENGSVIMKSSGKGVRDFITLTDVCRAIEFFIRADINVLDDGLFNLGGNNSMRIIDMVNLLIDRCEYVLGFRPDLIKDNKLDYNMAIADNLYYNTSKISNAGFNLVGDSDKEIDKLLMFCKENFTSE